MACTTEKRSISNGNKTVWSRIRGVIGRVIREADLQLGALLLPELYSTQSYYQLIVSITKMRESQSWNIY